MLQNPKILQNGALETQNGSKVSRTVVGQERNLGTSYEGRKSGMDLLYSCWWLKGLDGRK